jgi:hypothetical protein
MIECLLAFFLNCYMLQQGNHAPPVYSVIHRIPKRERVYISPLHRTFSNVLAMVQSCKKQDLSGEVGVWVGIQQMEYGSLAARCMQNMGAYTATGTPFSVAAGRISYIFGFKGPAVSLAPLSHKCGLDYISNTVKMML